MALRIHKKQGDVKTITIDKLGRVVIPQKLRERLGLFPGTKLVVESNTDDAVVLKLVQEVPEVRREKGKFPVILGKSKVDVDIVELIKKDREDYIQHILGLDKAK